MQWLVANMWMALAAAAVLGLLFGFSFRGVMSSARVRKAEIEREIARTELTQSKAEAEALYAAQRKRKEEVAQSVGGDDSLRQELDERESRISALGDELKAARDQLEQIRSESNGDNNLLGTAGAAVAGAVAGAVLSDDDQEEMTRLRDRNTWLEERVGALEADISAANAASEGSAPAIVGEEASTDVPAANVEKLQWQTTYMRQRVEALESKLVEKTAAAAVIATAPEVVELMEQPSEPASQAGPEVVSSNDTDEELAQLRWRNRYLEGRLAYFEEEPDAETDAGNEDDATALTDLSVDTDSPSEQESGAATDAEPEPAAEVIAVSEADTEPADESEPAAAAQEEVHPSEAMLAELEGTQPVQVDRPGSGGDDLTTITGIGPRIAEVLNSLGIWTYAQIAEWLPEHETWIENHLSFKGRVSRENWVGQAKDLLVSA